MDSSVWKLGLCLETVFAADIQLRWGHRGALAHGGPLGPADSGRGRTVPQSRALPEPGCWTSGCWDCGSELPSSGLCGHSPGRVRVLRPCGACSSPRAWSGLELRPGSAAAQGHRPLSLPVPPPPAALLRAQSLSGCRLGSGAWKPLVWGPRVAWQRPGG